jgi:hypothetical protein
MSFTAFSASALVNGVFNTDSSSVIEPDVSKTDCNFAMTKPDDFVISSE